MKYIEILEKLGLQYSVEEKFNKFATVIANAINAYEKKFIPFANAFGICQELGVLFQEERFGYIDTTNGGYRADRYLKYVLFEHRLSMLEFLTNLSVIIKNEFFKDEENSFLIRMIKFGLDNNNLPFIVHENIVIPKGDEILDSEIVLYCLDALYKYKDAYKNFINALKQYYEGNYTRNSADNLRVTLEVLVKELISKPSFRLENSQRDLAPWLETNGVEVYLRNLICNTIKDYCTFQNEYVKHNDIIKKEYMEYLVYQTGVIVRFLLSVQGW